MPKPVCFALTYRVASGHNKTEKRDKTSLLSKSQCLNTILEFTRTQWCEIWVKLIISVPVGLQYIINQSSLFIKTAVNLNDLNCNNTRCQMASHKQKAGKLHVDHELHFAHSGAKKKQREKLVYHPVICTSALTLHHRSFSILD